jgi:hypothetical protein
MTLRDEEREFNDVAAFPPAMMTRAASKSVDGEFPSLVLRLKRQIFNFNEPRR